MFNRAIFNNAIFNVGSDVPSVEVTVKTGSGGIEGRKRSTFKPLGFLDRPRKARKDIEERIEDSAAIQAEVALKLAREFSEGNAALKARGIEESEQNALSLKMAEEIKTAAAERKLAAAIKVREQDDQDILAITLLMIAADEE